MKRSIATIKAEALEPCAFELIFFPYAKVPKNNGMVTDIEVAAIPTGSMFRFTTYAQDENGDNILADISYQQIAGVHPVDCPLSDRRLFLYNGDLQKAIANGDAEYLEILEEDKPSEEKEEFDAEQINRELEERLADMEDDKVDNSTEEIEPEDAEFTEPAEETESTEDEDADESEETDSEEGEGFEFDETDDREEDEEEKEEKEEFNPDNLPTQEIDMPLEKIKEAIDTAISGNEDIVELKIPQNEDADEDESKEEEDSDGIEIGDMSPEEIRERLNNHYRGESKKDKKKKKKNKDKNKPIGRFIGAPENMSSHKEPYNAKVEEKNSVKQQKPAKNNFKQDKKAAKMKARQEQVDAIDFSAIVSKAFNN